MSHTKEWLKEQWMESRFRIFTICMMLLTIVLLAEFCIFQYEILKKVRYFSMFWILAGIAWNDGKRKRIPNQAIICMFVIRTIILVLECLVYRTYWMSILLDAGMGFLLGGGTFMLCYLITRGGIGAGDVKLLAVLGYQMGAGAIFSVIFMTVLIAALYSVFCLIRKKMDLKHEMAFAPFILAGTIITMMLGV